MRKLLFLFVMSVSIVACSDDENTGDLLPIKGLEIPKSDVPIKPGSSVTIKGIGFTKSSEIWFRSIASRSIVTRAVENTDVKATVTGVDTIGITFITPEVYGNQTVLLKENNQEYELGKMVFEEKQDSTGNTDNQDSTYILPKRIKTIKYTSTVISSIGEEPKFGVGHTYEYTYDDKNRIKTIKDIDEGEKEIYESVWTCTYTDEEITVKSVGDDEWNESYKLDKSGLCTDYKYTYTGDEKYLTEFKFLYTDKYLSSSAGVVEDDPVKETFVFVDSNWTKHISISEDEEYSVEFKYATQKNNLNIDLFAYLYQVDINTECGFILGLHGNRSAHLPKSVVLTEPEFNGDKVIGSKITNITFEYTMKDEYITKVIVYEDGKIDSKLEVFYEE